MPNDEVPAELRPAFEVLKDRGFADYGVVHLRQQWPQRIHVVYLMPGHYIVELGGLGDVRRVLGKVGHVEKDRRTGIVQVHLEDKASVLKYRAHQTVQVLDTTPLSWGEQREYGYIILPPGKAALNRHRLAMSAPKGKSGEPLAETKASNRGKKVNARMLEKFASDRESHGWNSPQWAKFLKCSKASVVNARAWKMIEEQRLKEKAERARDRRGRGTDRRKVDYGQD